MADCNAGNERTTLRTFSIWDTRENAGLEDVALDWGCEAAIWAVDSVTIKNKIAISQMKRYYRSYEFVHVNFV